MKVPVPEEILPADRLGRVHFVGIGGAGLSGIARIMLARGLEVSGSDGTDSPTLDALRALGARVHVGHAADQLGDADTVVVSTAVREDNPEYLEAVRRGLRVLPRSAALAAVMAGRRVVAVAGTHGKTTTTSLLTVALQVAGADPAYAIGGELSATGVNAADGTGEVFVAEADESDGAFLHYAPYAAIVTNIEADHLDNWGTEEAYRAAFDEFADTIDPDGFLVCCVDDPGAATLAERQRAAGRRVIEVSAHEPGALAEVTLWSPGDHYLADALAVLAAAGAPIQALQIVPGGPDWLHPGRSGTIQMGPKNVFGYFGELHPRALEALKADGPIVGFEVLLDRIPEPKAKATRAKPLLELSPFQPVSRDFAFLVARDVKADDVVRAAQNADKKLITTVTVFDVYEGKGVEDGKKSLAIAVTIQPRDKTMTDKEIDALAERIVAEVTKKTGGVLRA